MGRKYDLECPIAAALNVVGERWAIMILRDFFLHGTRRFQDLEESLTGITPTVLSQRLKDLVAQQVVKCKLYSEHPPRYEYSLTPKGRELGPVILALKNWGKKHA
jgi:DNA-binding HxlR family transcriptional regulator